MKKIDLKATTLHTTLAITVVIIIGLSGVGFYYIQGFLDKFSTDVSQTSTGSETDNKSPQAIKQLRDEITSYQTFASKASSLVASSKDYQSQVIQDLNKYATTAGISITSSNLAATAPTAATSINGVTSSYIAITIGNPVPFSNLMRFIKAIESNLPKMQLTGIKLARVAGSNDSVTVDPLTIKVYLK